MDGLREETTKPNSQDKQESRDYSSSKSLGSFFFFSKKVKVFGGWGTADAAQLNFRIFNFQYLTRTRFLHPYTYNN